MPEREDKKFGYIRLLRCAAAPRHVENGSMICEILGAVNCFAICLLAESSRVLALVDPMWTLAAVWSVGIMGMASAVKRRQ